jgi:hypothetical protein
MITRQAFRSAEISPRRMVITRKAATSSAEPETAGSINRDIPHMTCTDPAGLCREAFPFRSIKSHGAIRTLASKPEISFSVHCSAIDLVAEQSIFRRVRSPEHRCVR